MAASAAEPAGPTTAGASAGAVARLPPPPSPPRALAAADELPAAALGPVAAVRGGDGDGDAASGGTDRVPRSPCPFLRVGLAELVPPFVGPGRAQGVGTREVARRLEAAFPANDILPVDPSAGGAGWQVVDVPVGTASSARRPLTTISRVRFSSAILPQSLVDVVPLLSSVGGGSAERRAGPPTVWAWRCPLCGWTCLAAPVDGLLAHVAAAHGAAAAGRLFACSSCPAAFAGVAGLARHHRVVHGGGKAPGRWRR